MKTFNTLVISNCQKPLTTNHDSYSNLSRALDIPPPLICCSNMSAGGVAHRYRGQDGVRQVVAHGNPLPHRRAMRRAHDDRRHRRPARGPTGPSQGHLRHSTGEPRHRGSSTRTINMKISNNDQPQQGPICSTCSDVYVFVAVYLLFFVSSIVWFIGIYGMYSTMTESPETSDLMKR